MEDSDVELVQRARAGDTQAFGLLVNRYQTFVYNLALRVIHNSQEAEDLAQEAFVRAWLALPNFRAQAAFRTWLYRIVTNLCYNRLPQLRRELLMIECDTLAETEGISIDANPAKDAEANERRAFIHRQIDLLPESYRLLISLRYQQELSYEEIAKVVNLPTGTVKTGLFRAKEHLRETLRTLEEEPA